MTRWSIEAKYIADWLTHLPEGQYQEVIIALEYLAEQGPKGSRPFVDRIHHSRYHNLKELRPRKAAKNIRILFIFDPVQQAILLVAGDKAGNWEKWYKQNIPLAEGIYQKHLEELASKEKRT